MGRHIRAVSLEPRIVVRLATESADEPEGRSSCSFDDKRIHIDSDLPFRKSALVKIGGDQARARYSELSPGRSQYHFLAHHNHAFGAELLEALS